MRLGQLARHIDTTTTEIIEFLAEKGVEKNNHPNVKLNEEEETEVIRHFRPELFITEEEPQSIPLDEETQEATDIPDETKEEEAAAEHEEEIVEPDDTVQPIEPKPGKITLEESTTSPTPVTVTAADLNPDDEDAAIEYEHIDVIKAPKVELPGLKVLGKIDLPEPKVKEEEIEQEEPEVSEAQANTESGDEPKIVRHDKRNARRRLTEEEREARRQRNKKEKAKRLAKQEARKREQEERRLKKVKEQHYKQKINKPAPVAKPKKKKSSKSKEAEDTRPKPKTVLGKFWKWLNT